MRKAFLVIVLVAASFLGGAFVNGPGLQWVEAHLLRSLGLNNGGEIASVDLKPAVGSEIGPDELRSAKLGTEAPKIPHAPIPSVITDDELSQLNDSDRHSTFRARSKSNPLGPSSPDTEAKSVALASIERPIAMIKSLEQRVAPADPNVKQVNATSSPDSSGNSEHADGSAKPDILDTLAALLPPHSESTSSRLPSASSAPVTAAKKNRADKRDDWATVERKMQILGVSHFTVNGQPGDRVVFSCWIPLAGRQAVAERFEAEGDDMVQAAQATLRCITLWRATQ